MTNQNTTTRTARYGEILLGSLVVLLTVPTGFGPAVGGWLAGRQTTRPVDGAFASSIAGLLGALPWGILLYLASSGAFEPIGYHIGGVHIGINSATPGLLTPWQEVGLAVLIVGISVVFAVSGGVVGGFGRDSLDTIHERRSNST